MLEEETRMRCLRRRLGVAVLALGMAGCAPHVPTAGSAESVGATKGKAGDGSGDDLLFRRVWRVTNAPSPPAPQWPALIAR